MTGLFWFWSSIIGACGFIYWGVGMFSLFSMGTSVLLWTTGFYTIGDGFYCVCIEKDGAEVGKGDRTFSPSALTTYYYYNS